MSNAPGCNKKRGRVSRNYCVHGICTSNTLDKLEGVKMLPFPKPCRDHYLTLINDSLQHEVKDCSQCSTCLRWIQLCKHPDSKLLRLVDISSKTKICTKHFANGMGPTESDPDPYQTETYGTEWQLGRTPAKLRPVAIPPTPMKRRKLQASPPAPSPVSPQPGQNLGDGSDELQDLRWLVPISMFPHQPHDQLASDLRVQADTSLDIVQVPISLIMDAL